LNVTTVGAACSVADQMAEGAADDSTGKPSRSQGFQCIVEHAIASRADTSFQFQCTNGDKFVTFLAQPALTHRRAPLRRSDVAESVGRSISAFAKTSTDISVSPDSGLSALRAHGGVFRCSF